MTGLSAFCILYLIFVVYLGVYAYSNPDPAHSYYIDGLDTPGVTKDAALTLAKERDIGVR